MADTKPSWFDWLNVTASVFVGIVGIFVAYKLAASADHETRVSTMVATTTFLVDDNRKRQDVGIRIARALTTETNDNEVWFSQLVNDVTGSTPGSAPSDQGDTAWAPPPPLSPPGMAPAPPAASPPAPPGPAAVASGDVGERLFDELGGSNPRLFIQIAEEDQLEAARALRKGLASLHLGGQAVVAPGIQHVRTAPARFELRYLKAQDAAEAALIADWVNQRIGVKPAIVPMPHFFDDPKVKPRTYELWFYRGQPLQVTTAALQ